MIELFKKNLNRYLIINHLFSGDYTLNQLPFTKIKYIYAYLTSSFINKKNQFEVVFLFYRIFLICLTFLLNLMIKSIFVICDYSRLNNHI